MLNKSKYFLNNELDSFLKSEVTELQELLIYHSDLYHNKDTPIISDYEYDELLKRLEFLENKFDITITHASMVGSVVIESTFKKVKHSRPMISLGNTYNEEDLNDFNERILKLSTPPNLPLSRGGKEQVPLLTKEGLGEVSYTLEFKFDGLGVELIYIGGELTQAITRGDGVEGEDVTQNVMQIDNIPKTIPYTDHLEVRGEVVMPISVFQLINEKAKKAGEKIFSNPRNAASGSLRMKDNSVTKQRKLKFFAYDLANFEEFRVNENISEYFDVIKDIEKLGFEISSYFKNISGIGKVIDAINNFGDVKKQIDFEIDGLVLKVNDIMAWETIGRTEHHPRYAIAYKFPAEILTTQILSVEHSVGRTGTITPVANLEAINIGGVTVKRATLHNYEEVENLDVRVGDTVFIKRAGEVIPKIISVVKEGRKPDFEKILPPKECPSCSGKVVKDTDKVRYYCSNLYSCPAQISESLAWSVGKQGFNIDGLGERQVEIFLQEGIITNLASVFKISERSEDILSLEGFKEKSVHNLIVSIEKAKNLDISRFLTALGISGVGKKTSKTLSKLFKSSDDILHFSYTLEELESLEDIGPEIAANVLYYFSSVNNTELLTDLVEILDIQYFKEATTNTEGYFAGKKVCITGSFENYKREELAKLLEENGGEFMSSVSKKTDYLLAGDKAGSKLKKANELGISILNIEEFLNII